MLEIKPLNYVSVYLDRLIKSKLWFMVIIALVLGAGLGVLVNPNTGLVLEDFSTSLSHFVSSKQNNKL